MKLMYVSLFGDFHGDDNRQTDKQTDYFTLVHACGVITQQLTNNIFKCMYALLNEACNMQFYTYLGFCTCCNACIDKNTHIHDSCHNRISSFIIYHFLLIRYRIRNPTTTIDKSTMITNNPTTVKVINTNCEFP